METEIMQLVMLKDKSTITNSLIIAEVFDKDHKDVLRAIRNLIKDVSDSQAQEHQRNFALMFLCPKISGTFSNFLYQIY